MNNSAFRNLISKNTSSDVSQDDKKAQFKTPMLGSRARSSIPMTPRNVPGYNNRSEFARQVAAQTSPSDGPPAKRFKSASAPKGSRLAKGYTDRAATLRNEEAIETDQDDREKRLKALEEMMKLQQITSEDFERMKADMGIGGDTSSTHLVKGLDWKLLERVRRGEDVTKSDKQEEDELEKEDKKDEVDVEDELEKALERGPTGQDEPQEQQEEDPDETSTETAQPMTRDQILQRLKESRNAAASSTATTKAMAPAPVLGGKFKKVAAPEKRAKHKYTETVNGRRREVLVINKRDGTTKRKTRWLDPEDITKSETQILGMEVPSDIAAKAARDAAAAAAEEEDDDDIFQGVGADYDPLADIKSDDSDGEEAATKSDKPGLDSQQNGTASTTPATATSQKRNYFATSEETKEEDGTSKDHLARDPTILAALKRAADIRRREEKDDQNIDSTNPEQDAKQKQFLQKLREREQQDNADLDYGFGESRFGDAEDEEVFVEEEGDKKSGRKRGGKKRKGDKNDVKDVMGVLQSRDKKT